MKINISNIVSSDLCVSCGSCFKVCNSEAISISFKNGLFIPHVEETKCTSCGLCLKICPSHEIDVQKTYGELDFYRDDLESYVAYTKNERLRHQSTSGGVVSSMVYDLLKKGIYEKAYTLEYESFQGNKAVLHAIYDPDDVYKSLKSKYIPASVEEVIEDIKEHKIAKSIVVGTPCQFLAIKRCMSSQKQEDKDVLFVGLFCDKTLNYNVYRYYGLKYGKFDSMHFRDKDGNGWPGDTVLCKDKKKTIVDKSVRMSIKPFLQLNRCFYCFDMLNMLADISCGDCYIEGEESVEGKSSVIIRTIKGRKAFENCRENLNCSISSFGAIKDSQDLDMKLGNVARNKLNDCVFVNFPACLMEHISPEINVTHVNNQRLLLGKCIESIDDVFRIDNELKKNEKHKKKNALIELLSRIGKLVYNPNKKTIVLIDNAGFVNKGAELMLCSIVQQLQKRLPNVQIVLPKELFYENPSYCIKNRIVPLQQPSVKIIRVWKSFVYNNILNKPWYITPDQIDVVLDAGGFQFSDQWNPTEQNIKLLTKYYNSFTKKRRKIIFLPQAFGPFCEDRSRILMKNVYQCADLLYAREKTSYDYLKDLFPNDNKIRLCPDFTCLSEQTEDKTIDLSNNYVLIVPNSRMITHTNSEVSSDYIYFLKEIIAFLVGKGERVVLLNHEGKDDKRLLEEINNSLPQKLLLLSDLSALEVKRIIAGAKLLVSSRFHGVVSGLTQGIPTLCTSWSHKYYELLKEHKCESNILNVDNLDEAKRIIGSALICPHEYSSKNGCSDSIKNQSIEMWDDVFSIIEMR